ncbi:MAG: MotA/TolQ/ExbB proton channel family protein [Planctomycetales bacterium]|nr:MotA/TolQ/ExbB proton channel family protein [Planctomycetales bacterium]
MRLLSRNRQSRLVFFLLACLTLSAGFGVMTSPSVAFGQGDENAQNQPANTGDSVPPPNYLEWAFDALGWGYSGVFLTLSVTLVALIVMNIMTARRENVCPMSLLEGFETHLNERRYQEAYELAKSDDSFLGRVLSAGLAKLSSGYSQAIEAMQEIGEEENMKLEHRLSYMQLIGTISPMIGLFGTVQGMISSFQIIANTDTQPRPSELAGGISTALFTTLIGLLIAIPAIACYNILRNQIARLVLEVGILSEGLMSRFENLDKKKST